ncbi:transcription factor GTE1 [Medicago truncatula]|uniref:transcription factor GTE1 n=1 Tax=Medicago truncatula TaxID=3880 RepID=UPI000D2F1A0C|nr:transcription factor GTE1 [Medicago truncatula]
MQSSLNQSINMAMNPNQQHISTEDLNRYRHFLSQLDSQVNKLGKQVNDVEQFYQSTDVQQNDCKYKGREKPPTGSKKALKRASEDMQAEMRHNFNKIFNEIAKDKWAWPFLDPVDVEGLGLYDYYQIFS